MILRAVKLWGVLVREGKETNCNGEHTKMHEEKSQVREGQVVLSGPFRVVDNCQFLDSNKKFW